MCKPHLTPRQSLNKSFLKLNPNCNEIENFKMEFIALLEGNNEKESEEFQKNLISNFLKKIGFEPQYYINTKGRNDLVISILRFWLLPSAYPLKLKET